MTTTLTGPLAGGQIRTIDKNERLFGLDGISKKTIEEHWKLYEGYVKKWLEIEKKLKDVELSTANQTFSDLRALKTDLTFAIGGVKNHQVYFEHLGGDGSAPTGWIGDQIERQWGSYDNWKKELKATGMAGRGWAWMAFDWDTGKLGNYLGDAQNTYPIWNAVPLVALDVYEHAYFIDYGGDRGSYIEAFLRNLDWRTVEKRAEMLGITKAGH